MQYLKSNTDLQNEQISKLEKENKRIRKNWEISKKQQRRLYDNLKQRNEVLEKALELACDNLEQINLIFGVEYVDTMKIFIEKAEKETIK